jgi:hypothetical protein
LALIRLNARAFAASAAQRAILTVAEVGKIKSALAAIFTNAAEAIAGAGVFKI